MSFVTKRVRIGGMTCVNCQNKIEQKLRTTAGVKGAVVSYQTGMAEITYDNDLIHLNDIISVIEKLDYKVLPEEQSEKTDIGRTVCLLVIIVALYMLLQRSGILNLLVPSRLADTKMGYGMLFVIGLITSVHCIAMCGGINLSQCIPQRGMENSKNGLAAFFPSVFYNLGRVISYTGIGFVLGLLGMLLGGGAGTGLSVFSQGILKLIAGTFMVIMGINMLGIFPWLRRIGLRMPKSLAVKINRQKWKSRQPFFIGLLNGLMPCGPLQSMWIVALASGNPFAGALSMFLFSLGTVPLMLGLGSIVAALGKKFTRKVMTVGAVLVVVLGLAMLSQGGSLSGLLSPEQLLVLVVIFAAAGVAADIPFKKAVWRAAGVAGMLVILLTVGTAGMQRNTFTEQENPGSDGEETEIVDGVQVVNSTLTLGRYPNITVQAGTKVKWIIDAPEGSINGCNYKMIIRDLGIEHTFTQGENVIEFTPVKAGTISYSCWMGMIYGNIFVTEKTDETEAGGGTEGAAASADVPVPAGYKIPSDELAVAKKETDANGQPVQNVTIQLTREGFSPAVVVVESGTAVNWTIVSELDTEDTLLAPYYSSKLPLTAGENPLYLYPTESFEVSTGSHEFYAYVKVVDDIGQIDEKEIQDEADAFETIIYPEAIFESSAAGASCCGGM